MGKDDEGDHGYLPHRSTINSKVMIITFTSLFFVFVIVGLLHLLCRRRARRRTVVARHFNIGIIASQTQTHQAPKTGLDPCVIATLPIFVYKHKDGLGDGSAFECAVCLSAIEEDEMARLLPNCKHTFHAQCIDEWLHSHSTCPICRTGVEPRPEDEAGDSVAVGATAPPVNMLMSMASEGTSDAGAQCSKVGGSGSRLSSFRRMLTRERSDRRLQPSAPPDDALEDLERR